MTWGGEQPTAGNHIAGRNNSSARNGIVQCNGASSGLEATAYARIVDEQLKVKIQHR